MEVRGVGEQVEEGKRLFMRIKTGTPPAGKIVIVKMDSRVRGRVEMLWGSARSSVKGTQTVAMDSSVGLVRASETVRKSERSVRIAACAVSTMTTGTGIRMLSVGRVMMRRSCGVEYKGFSHLLLRALPHARLSAVL